MNKIYDISMENNIETNHFLRCLWSRLRSNFGKLSWYFNPNRIGNSKTILLGSVDLGLVSNNSTPTSISCTYSKKGCIKNLIWENKSLLNPKVFEKKFEASIKEALEYEKHKKQYSLQHFLDENISFKAYKGENFSVTKNSLFFKIEAYDKIDYTTFGRSICELIICFLSFDTLQYITSTNSGIERIRRENEREFVLVSFETGEETSSTKTNNKIKELTISSKTGNWIDKFLEREFDYDKPFSKFEKGVQAFRQGLFFEEISNTDFKLDFSSLEYAAINYMSTLEIITLNDNEPEKCNSCGQQKFSIAQRVKKLVSEATSNNRHAEDLVNRYYSIRSKFVHTGAFLASNNYIGSSLPLLSVNGSDGVIHQNPFIHYELKELVKTCVIWKQEKKEN